LCHSARERGREVLEDAELDLRVEAAKLVAPDSSGKLLDSMP